MRQVEEAFVGSILRHPSCLPDVMGIVNPHDLGGRGCAVAYQAAIDLFKGGHTVDLVAVVKHIGVDKCDAAYLSGLLDVGSKSSLGHYAGEIAREVQRKRIGLAIKRVENVLANDGAAAALTWLSDLIATELRTDKKDPRIKEAIGRFEKIQHEYRSKGQMGVTTGMDCFERNYIQYVPGHVWVVGAGTSTGKTAMSIQQRESAAPHRGMFISTEMTEEQLIARIIANRTAIPSPLILSGRLNPSQDERVEREKAILQKEDLKIYDDIYHIDDIENVVMKAHLQGGVDVAWVDYVQNITSNELNEYQSMAKTAKRLQALAKRARCCLVLLSQLPNESVDNDNGTVKFKGAGEWAAIADVGIILKKAKGSDLLRQEIRKNRHGRLGNQVFMFANGYTSLEAIQHDDNS